MARQARTIGTIKCRTNLKTLQVIAETGGLNAEHAGFGQFKILDSGRALETDMQSDLLAAVSTTLDEAVERHVIPQWVRVHTD